MMFAGSSVSSKISPGPASLPSLSLLSKLDMEVPEEADGSSTFSNVPLPCWATQAICELSKCEMELGRLRELQAAEMEQVSRGVERAMLGARREEQRLLERVQQDHRDLQRRLDQLQRENTAASRVSQALVDQQLRKVAQLRDEMQNSSSEWIRDGDDHVTNPKWDALQKSVAELLRPWEISLLLKHVSFKPSAQPKAIAFGEIKVQDRSVHFPVDGCGPQGQLCSLHANGSLNRGQAELDGGVRCTSGGRDVGQGKEINTLTGNGNMRIVHKIRLSGRRDEESQEDVRQSPPKLRCWPPKRDRGEHESSQEDEMVSPSSENRGEEMFLAVPALLSNGESEGEDMGCFQNGTVRPLDPQVERKRRELSLSSHQGHQGQHGLYLHSFDLHDEEPDKGRGRLSSPRGITHGGNRTRLSARSPRDSLSSHSCQDLSLRDRPHSRLSVSSDDHIHGRAPSPTDSVDSGYTFIISSPQDCPNNTYSDTRRSKSTTDLSHHGRPLIIGDRNNQQGTWRVNRSSLASLSRSPSQRRGKLSPTLSYPGQGHPGPKHSVQGAMENRLCGVSRSLSMSVIDGAHQDRHGSHSPYAREQSQSRGLLRGERSEPTLLELEEDDQPLAPDEVRLVRQFGKQGSGRADLTLPSGIYVTPQGQLFLVDCGNARVQITDSRGNVLQQVTSPGIDQGGSSRRCRNYFDVAVNAKGLIALSCAAERALLIFSRHGRLLQTFGGGTYTAGVPRDELEAPRGVTVTERDEFLVADIRKGTLTAMKLEPKTGSRLERTVVTGFHRPYLVAACQSAGLVAVSERGSETGRDPCVKVLGPGWNTLRVLGVCSGLGPVLSSPWGLCIDREGSVIVADWAECHRVVLYPVEGTGRAIVTQGLSSPRGLALLPDGLLVVSDSMHHCIKIYQYK